MTDYLLQNIKWTDPNLFSSELIFLPTPSPCHFFTAPPTPTCQSLHYTMARALHWWPPTSCIHFQNISLCWKSKGLLVSKLVCIQKEELREEAGGLCFSGLSSQLHWSWVLLSVMCSVCVTAGDRWCCMMSLLMLEQMLLIFILPPTLQERGWGGEEHQLDLKLDWETGGKHLGEGERGGMCSNCIIWKNLKFKTEIKLKTSK